MTDDLFTIKDSAIQNHLFPVIYQEVIFPQPWSGTSQKGDLSSRKRQTFYRWCSRIAVSGFAGSDLVIEYIYSKIYTESLYPHNQTV